MDTVDLDSSANATPKASGAAKRREFRNTHVTQLVAYRLPPAGIVSILHRVSGAWLFLTLPLLLWLFELSVTSELTFIRLGEVASSWWVKLILLVLVWGFWHHLAAGVRYVLLDLHLGIDKVSSNLSARIVLGVGVALTLLSALWLFGAF